MKTKIKQIILLLLILPLFFTCKDKEEDPNHISNLPPMKSQFAGKFLIGNIMNPEDVSGGKLSNQNLIRHFNILTCENHMKPSYLSPQKGSYDFTTANNMVNSARASGMLVVGHTLLWHSQNANWMTSSVSEKDMTDYIEKVVGNFKGKIYSWDVLNEVFPDSVKATDDWTKVMRSENPWYKSTMGSDFVYKGFLAARKADPNAILYYNDYNTDSADKAQMIYNMVKAVNDKYSTSGDKPAGEKNERLLIEGIGMQEHHNLWVDANSIKKTLELFKPLGVKISVSELDVLSQTYQDFADKKAVTDTGRADQAKKYGEYMKVYLEFSDIIERVSLWGIYDNKSWRAKGEPLLFNASGIAKPAYYNFVGAK